MAGITVININ